MAGGNGSDAEFEALFRATYPRVLSYARAMADGHDADDAVGEVYAIAWRHQERVQPGLSSAG